jgi:hypothetical protein
VAAPLSPRPHRLKIVVFGKSGAENTYNMTRAKLELGAIFALLYLVIPSLQYLNANPPEVRFFINTAVEWRSERDNSVQHWNTATGQIYGPTQIIGLYSDGKLALLFGYVEYYPKTRAFEFAPTEGFSVYVGKWEETEKDSLKVAYRFALGEKLACPLGSKSYDDCYGFRYKQPAVVSEWSQIHLADGNIASIEARLKDDATPRHFVVLSKLTNYEEVVQILRSAEKKLSGHPTPSPHN